MYQYTTMTALSLYDFLKSEGGKVSTVSAVGVGDREVTLPPETAIKQVIKVQAEDGTEWIGLDLQVQTDATWSHPSFTTLFRLPFDSRVACYADVPVYRSYPVWDKP